MRLCLTLLCLLIPLPALAAQLTLELGNGSRHWQSEQLLTHPQARDVTIEQDVAYKRTMHYRAVPLAALLEGVKPSDHLQAVALDGFVAEMPAGPLLQPGPAQAWLAIEDNAQPWPPLGQGKAGAGPFYLVWIQPQASGIRPEQWPFQIASIRSLAAVEVRFPPYCQTQRCPTRIRCARALPCSSRIAWPATASMALAMRTWVLT